MPSGRTPWSIGPWRKRDWEKSRLKLLLLSIHRARRDDLMIDCRKVARETFVATSKGNIGDEMKCIFGLLVIGWLGFEELRPRARDRFSEAMDRWTPTEQSYCVRHESCHCSRESGLASTVREFLSLKEQRVLRADLRVEDLGEFFEFRQGRTEFQVVMITIQQNRGNGLCGTGVGDHLVHPLSQVLQRCRWTFTCLAKKISSSRESLTMFSPDVSIACHLNKKISPWHGLSQCSCPTSIRTYFICSRLSSSKEKISSTWTPSAPRRTKNKFKQMIRRPYRTRESDQWRHRDRIRSNTIPLRPSLLNALGGESNLERSEQWNRRTGWEHLSNQYIQSKCSSGMTSYDSSRSPIPRSSCWAWVHFWIRSVGKFFDGFWKKRIEMKWRSEENRTDFFSLWWWTGLEDLSVSPCSAFSWA